MLLASLIPHQLRRRGWAIDLGIDNNGNTVLISPDSVDASYYRSDAILNLNWHWKNGFI